MAQESAHRETTPPAPKEELRVPAEAGAGEAIPNEILERLPPDAQKAIRAAFTQFTFGPVSDSLLSKVHSGHITDLIKASDAESEREYQDRREARRYTFWVFVVSVIAILGLVTFAIAMGKTDIVVPIIAALGGLGAGYGLGKRAKRGE